MTLLTGVSLVEKKCPLPCLSNVIRLEVTN
jgi:hypothetical protein